MRICYFTNQGRPVVITDLSLKLDAPIPSQSIKLTVRHSFLKLEPIPHTLPNFNLDKNKLRRYCKEPFFTQRLDQFSAAHNTYFPQRYFFCDPYELNAATGLLAASAPVLAFMGDQRPVDMKGFTFGAAVGAGASNNCAAISGKADDACGS
uniref:AlNc14C194G8535 protein n=1 Tax=Albugo laibachii Nc14 TaxID=890382 RepID=F0WQ55_9STRA|nr:AlNc14C194G8535 [Albugo laibachii Nc14]|eukprot:CCA23460.1 AlNc14C194G8535 [Albugo laibachii Nc14]